MFVFGFKSPRILPAIALLVCLLTLVGCSGDSGDKRTAPEDASASSAADTQVFSPPPLQQLDPESTAATAPSVQQLEPVATIQQIPAGDRSVRSAPYSTAQSLPTVAIAPKPAAAKSQVATDASQPDAIDPRSGEHLSQLPAGAQRGEEGFSTVQVFYATDRSRDALSLADYELTGQKNLFMMFAL